MRTPWGPSDYEKEYAEGVTFYGTPSHGGFKLSAARNRDVVPSLRLDGGWYEEDCDWYRVAYTFPQLFVDPETEAFRDTETVVATALSGIRNWMPDEYETLTGETIALGESTWRDHQLAEKEKVTA